MKRYELQKHQDMNHTFYAIRNLDTMEWFAGYDFMGSVDWVASPADSYEMSKEEALDVLEDLVASDDEPEEAEAIIEELKAADEPAEPTKAPVMTLYEVGMKHIETGEKLTVQVWGTNVDQATNKLLNSLLGPDNQYIWTGSGPVYKNNKLVTR